MASIDPLMRRFFVLHARMQQFFRAWDLADAAHVRRRLHQRRRSWSRLFRLQSALGGPRQDDDELRRTLAENLALLERFAARLAGPRRPTTDPALGRFVPRPAGEPVDISALTFRPVGVTVRT